MCNSEIKREVTGGFNKLHGPSLSSQLPEQSNQERFYGARKQVNTCTALVFIFSLAFLLIHRGAFLDKELFSKMK